MQKKTFLERNSVEQRYALADDCAIAMTQKAESLGMTIRKSIFSSSGKLADDLFECQEKEGRSMQIDFETASKVWADDISLSISFEQSDYASKGLTASARLSWSSTGRSVSQALNAIDRYNNALKMAAFVESLF